MKNVTLAQTWHAKHAYIDLACEILQRPQYVPTMSRQGGPKDETGLVTLTVAEIIKKYAGIAEGLRKKII